MFTRRAFGALLLSSCARATLPLQPTKRPATSPPPPYHVVFVLGGGFDSVLVTDPKTKAEVEQDIDVPFNANEIVSTSRFGLGPLGAPLAPFADRMAIISNVRTATVSHHPGLSQLHRMRLGATTVSTDPSFLELVGTRRTTQPLPVVTVTSDGWPFMASPGHITIDTILEAAKLSHEERATAANALRAQARDARSLKDPHGLAAAERLTSLADLCERLQSVPKFEVATWSEDEEQQSVALELQQVLWLLKHDLTLSVEWIRYPHWDTHEYNLTIQTQHGKAFFPMLARFLDELAKTTNQRGVLADNTRLILGSEVGRFPRLNPLAGKHHFPEVDYVIIDSKVAPGRHGGSDRRRSALPVSLRTGKPEAGGTIVTLEDLGTTLIASAGLEPAVFGFRGQRLGYLL